MARVTVPPRGTSGRPDRTIHHSAFPAMDGLLPVCLTGFCCRLSSPTAVLSVRPTARCWLDVLACLVTTFRLAAFYCSDAIFDGAFLVPPAPFSVDYVCMCRMLCHFPDLILQGLEVKLPIWRGCQDRELHKFGFRSLASSIEETEW